MKMYYCDFDLLAKILRIFFFFAIYILKGFYSGNLFIEFQNSIFFANT